MADRVKRRRWSAADKLEICDCAERDPAPRLAQGSAFRSNWAGLAVVTGSAIG